MQRQQYTILLEVDGEDAEHVIEIRNVDRLQAEVSGRQYGLLASLEDAPQTWTTHWFWHACKRLGIYTATWQDFKDALVDYEPVEDAGDVPPTQAAELTSSVSP